MARTRDPAIDRAIDEATVKLLASQGLSGVTIDAVATEAGVARTTVYRRYDNVAEMVEAAVDNLLGMPDPDPSLEGQEAWRQIMESLRSALFESAGGLNLLAALLVAESDHPDLLEIWRSRVVSNRIDLIASRLGWTEPQARQMGELALGGLIAGFISRGDDSRDRARALADTLWNRLGSKL